jgi:hypothetical protein
MIEKINVLFESEDDAKLFRESLEEFRLNKKIGHIYKVNLSYDESGKGKFNCEIYKVEDDLVKNIEALIKRFNGKRSY